ncbi:MAG: hypothetical protein U0869_13985 [Chloroflexota bacterium]
MRAVVLSVAAMAATVVGGGAALAVVPPPIVQLGSVTLGDPVVHAGTADGSLKVRLVQKRGGRTIASDVKRPDSSGFVDLTVKPVKGGDVLVVTRGTITRSVRVPALQLAGNAFTGYVSGRTPTPSAPTTVYVSYGVGGYTMGSDDVPVVTDTHGRFWFDLLPPWGAEELRLDWRNAALDTFHAVAGLTAVQVRTGQAKVWAWGRLGQAVTVELRSINGGLRGVATVRIPTYATSGLGTFRKNGVAVKVRPGDRIRALDHLLLVPLTPSISAAPTSVSATCFPSQSWLVGTLSPQGAVSYLDDGTADPSGTVSGSWAGSLPSGARIILFCENDLGSTQELVGTVP